MGRFLRIEWSGCLLGALCLYLLPLRWVLGAVCAGVVHELGHLLALRLTGATVYSVSLGGIGAKIETSPLERIQELCCALAGPVGSLSMMLFCRGFPEGAICGLFQGLFNLLPVYPMDGGRAACCVFPEKVCDWMEKIVTVLLTVLGFWLNWVWLPVLALAMRCRDRKIPCKETKKAVQ